MSDTNFVREREAAQWMSATINSNVFIESEEAKKIMVLRLADAEASGTLNKAQRRKFKAFHMYAEGKAKKLGYGYWGFFILKLPHGGTMSGPGMTLNDKPITEEELRDHIAFKTKFCEALSAEGLPIH